MLANPQKQNLAMHSYAIARLSVSILKTLIPSIDPLYVLAAYVAGCNHDLGKVDPNFQKWASGNIPVIEEDGHHITDNKFTFEKYPRHNELSILLYKLLADTSLIGNHSMKKLIEHVIFWHHAKPFRKDDLRTYNDVLILLEKKKIDVSNFIPLVNQLFNDINTLSTNDGFNLALPLFKTHITPDDIDQVRELSLPRYKEYMKRSNINGYGSDIKYHAISSIIRAVVISADRTISKFTVNELQDLVRTETYDTLAQSHLAHSSALSSEIDAMIAQYQAGGDASRNAVQATAATSLAAINDVAVLQGPAGVGKTKTGLEWAKNRNANRIIWVCPRVQVCQSIFHELTTDYLVNCNVEIYTGEFKLMGRNGVVTENANMFSGDVIITTIDQVVNSLVTHNQVTTLVDYMNSHIIFDEYHEYVGMECFDVLFAELVECKKFQSSPNIMLMSATPNYVFLQDFLDIDSHDVVKMLSFNTSLYQIKLQDYDEEVQKSPIHDTQPVNTIVVCNTARDAQLSYISNSSAESSLLFHSKYTMSDKNTIFTSVMTTFGKGGSKVYDVLRASPIVQASLNITCFNMVSEISSAENILQRLGRLDRFGENTIENVYSITHPIKLNGNKNCGQMLANMNILSSSKAWLAHLSKRLKPQSYTINQIYDLYESFYTDPKNRDIVIRDISNGIERSIELLAEKVIDPVQFPKTSHALDKPVIKKVSMRGSNVFVQMAVVELDHTTVLKNAESYVYNPDVAIPDQDRGTLTMDRLELNGYNNQSETPISYMKRKHKNIVGDNTLAYKNLMNSARDSDTPVYTSYITTDLVKVGDSVNPDCAYFYVKGNQQPIGIMSKRNISTVVDNMK